MAELNIDPETVRRLIVKARAALAQVPDAEEEDVDSELDIDPATSVETRNHDHLEEEGEPDHTIEEVAAFIDGLDDDERADVVALVWVGRGDFEPRDFADAQEEARVIAERVSDYLLGMPLLPSYLEAGLDAVEEED